jgi:hypothetical protein
LIRAREVHDDSARCASAAARPPRGARLTPPLVAILAALAVVPKPTGAQQRDSARVGVRPAATAQQPARRDTLGPPISPRRAFFYSFLVPGYGQSRLDRPLAGALFFSVEAASIALAVQASNELRYAREHVKDSVVARYRFSGGTVVIDTLTKLPVIDSVEVNDFPQARVNARKVHLEDWYALLIFNHLIAGVEAFVSAQLWDLPSHVSIRALHRGAAVSASIPW